MSADVIPLSIGNPRQRISAVRARFTTKSLQTAIRPCRRKDLARITEIHKARFLVPGALLGRLSPALIAAFYGVFLDRSTFLVHTGDDEVDGFVLGGPNAELANCKVSFFREHALLGLADIMHRPHLWLRAFRPCVKLIARCMSSISAGAPHEDLRMLSLAVDTRAARRGVGTALVRAFEAAIRPASQTYTLNVLKTNAAAIQFYEQLAFRCVGETAITWTLRKGLATDARADGAAITNTDFSQVNASRASKAG
jgi:ribosomal protein S18 acetylase RimI-like enzyme